MKRGKRRRRWIGVERGAPRPLLREDRRKILRELNVRCRPSERGHVTFCALRLRAAVLLAAQSGLRIAEMLRLDAVQVIDDPTVARWRIRSLGYLRPEQAKGRRVGDDQWDSSGTFCIGDQSRTALRAYLAEAKRREYVSWPPQPGEPLFVAVRRNGDGSARHRLSVRTLQWQWTQFQIRCALVSPYHWHCLRHDALEQCHDASGGNTKMVAAFGRCSIQTALRYGAQPTLPRVLELRNQIAMR